MAGAAAAKRRQEEEEESMSAYNSDDLNGWEFKIVRSVFGRFSNYQAVQKICQERPRTDGNWWRNSMSTVCASNEE